MSSKETNENHTRTGIVKDAGEGRAPKKVHFDSEVDREESRRRGVLEAELAENVRKKADVAAEIEEMRQTLVAQLLESGEAARHLMEQNKWILEPFTKEDCADDLENLQTGLSSLRDWNTRRLEESGALLCTGPTSKTDVEPGEVNKATDAGDGWKNGTGSSDKSGNPSNDQKDKPESDHQAPASQIQEPTDHDYEPTLYSILVYDIAFEVTPYVLFTTFRPRFESCKSSRIMIRPCNGILRNFGIVRFTDETERERAVDEMQGALCDGLPMLILPISRMHSVRSRILPETSIYTFVTNSDAPPPSLDLAAEISDSNTSSDVYVQIRRDLQVFSGVFREVSRYPEVASEEDVDPSPNLKSPERKILQPVSRLPNDAQSGISSPESANRGDFTSIQIDASEVPLPGSSAVLWSNLSQPDVLAEIDQIQRPGRGLKEGRSRTDRSNEAESSTAMNIHDREWLHYNALQFAQQRTARGAGCDKLAEVKSTDDQATHIMDQVHHDGCTTELGKMGLPFRLIELIQEHQQNVDVALKQFQSEVKMDDGTPESVAVAAAIPLPSSPSNHSSRNLGSSARPSAKNSVLPGRVLSLALRHRDNMAKALADLQALTRKEDKPSEDSAANSIEPAGDGPERENPNVLANELRVHREIVKADVDKELSKVLKMNARRKAETKMARANTDEARAKLEDTMNELRAVRDQLDGLKKELAEMRKVASESDAASRRSRSSDRCKHQ